MAACFTFGAAMTLRAGGHIRVRLLLSRLSPPSYRLAEVGLAIAGAVFTGFIAYAMVRFTWYSFTRGQVSLGSASPLWIPQAAVTFGFMLLFLQFTARVIQGALGLKLENEDLARPALSE
jgi:TRAP-type C4-dicarboxylate transport system permease small subunit